MKKLYLKTLSNGDEKQFGKIISEKDNGIQFQLENGDVYFVKKNDIVEFEEIETVNDNVKKCTITLNKNSAAYDDSNFAYEVLLKDKDTTAALVTNNLELQNQLEPVYNGFGHRRNINYRPENSLSFSSKDAAVFQHMLEWYQVVHTSIGTPKIDYIKDIEINQFDNRTGDIIRKITVRNAWPSSISNGSNLNDDVFHKYTFSMDYFEETLS